MEVDPVSSQAHALSYQIPIITIEIIQPSPHFIAEETEGSGDLAKCHRT